MTIPWSNPCQLTSNFKYGFWLAAVCAEIYIQYTGFSSKIVWQYCIKHDRSMSQVNEIYTISPQPHVVDTNINKEIMLLYASLIL